MSLIVGVFASLGGAFATAWGYRRRQYKSVIDGTPTTRILDVDEPGLVELTGTARAIDGAGEERNVRAPLSGDSCLAAGWRVEEWEEHGDRSSWQEVAEGYDSVPFEVDDGSASIRVDPGYAGSRDGLTDFGDSIGAPSNSVVEDGATIDFQELDVVGQLAPDESKPARVAEFERNAPGVHEQTGSVTNIVDVGNAHGERKYYEGTIQPGEDVYVLGTVESEGGNADGDATRQRLHPDDAVVTPAGEEPFILSNRSEAELLDESSYGTPAMIAGVVLLLVGLLTVATGALPV